jgi:zinc protease
MVVPVTNQEWSMSHSASAGALFANGFAAKVRSNVLSNGLTVLVQSIPGTGAVSIVGKLRAGDAFAGGYSLVPGMVAEMLTHGSAKLSKIEIARMSQRMGALHFGTGTFDLNWGSTVTAANFAAFMELTAQVLRSPSFADEELALTKRFFASSITRSASNPEEVSGNALAGKLYTSGPYFQKPFAEAEAELEEIDAMMLRQFYNGHVAPHGGVIVIVGDVDSDAAFHLVERLFGDWRGPQAQPIAIVDSPLPMKARFNVPVGDDSSLEVVIGRRSSVRWSNPDFCAARIGNLILGGDTINSRLGKEVRVKHSLTYGVNSGFNSLYVSGGPWTISLATDASKLERALALVDEVTARFLADGVTDFEVANQASRAAESFIVNLRTDGKVADAIADLAFNGLGVEELDFYPTRLKAVTRGQVNAAIREHFTLDNAVTIAAGKVA